MSQTHPDILKRIRAAKDQGLKELNLSPQTIQTHLTQLPPELLESLNLGNNKLISLPEWLDHLTHLTSLDLGNNPIETSPPEVLDLDHNDQANLEKIRNYFRQITANGRSRFGWPVSTDVIC